ncbi:MAG: hypothetical protein ABWZ15_17890 [Acidimicrobiia bacterium]
MEFPTAPSRCGARSDAVSGEHTARVHFAFDGGGVGKGGERAVEIDGNEHARGRVERTQPYMFPSMRRSTVGEVVVVVVADLHLTWRDISDKAEHRTAIAGSTPSKRAKFWPVRLGGQLTEQSSRERRLAAARAVGSYRDGVTMP